MSFHFLEFSDKNAAAVFWNGEIETELRVAGQLDYYGLFHKNEDREIVMEEIERRRAESVYGHSPQDCSDDCKKRGMLFFCCLMVQFGHTIPTLFI